MARLLVASRPGRCCARGRATQHILRHCAKTIVAFRSAKVRSFAERKATIRRLVLAQRLSAASGRNEIIRGIALPSVGAYSWSVLETTPHEQFPQPENRTRQTGRDDGRD